MKSAVSFLGCVVRLVGSRVLLAAAIGMFVLGISFAHAQAPLPATSSLTVWVQCGDPVSGASNKAIKPTGDYDLEHHCGPKVLPWGTLGSTTYSASGTTSIKFVELGGGVPVIGKITGKVVSSFDGYAKNNSMAGIYSYFWYYFNIVRGGNLPWVPPTLPILFTARGKGYVEAGRGAFDVYAVMGMYGTVLPTSFPKDLFRITTGQTGKVAPYAACFGGDPNTCQKSVTLDLPVNDPRQPYLVQIAATSPWPGATTPYSTGLNVSNNVSSVTVYVDNPILSFDQNTFNTKCAQQGKTPFTLSDYYRLEFSPNLNIR